MRMVAPENIVGVQQAAARLGVSLTTLDNYIQGIRGKHHPFPEPLTIVNARTKVWDWTEIEEWAKNYVPAKGGAPLGNTNNDGKFHGNQHVKQPLTVKTEKGWRNAS